MPLKFKIIFVNGGDIENFFSTAWLNHLSNNNLVQTGEHIIFRNYASFFKINGLLQTYESSIRYYYKAVLIVIVFNRKRINISLVNILVKGLSFKGLKKTELGFKSTFYKIANLGLMILIVQYMCLIKLIFRIGYGLLTL